MTWSTPASSAALVTGHGSRQGGRVAGVDLIEVVHRAHVRIAAAPARLGR